LCAVYNDKFNCDLCTPRNDTAQEKARCKDRREKYGCEKKDYPVFTYRETAEHFYQCPVKLVKKSSWELFEIYQHYQAGFLPFSGGSMEQPEWLMKRLAYIHGLRMKIERERNSREKIDD